MNQLIKLTSSKNESEVWVNPEFVFYMETGETIKDKAKYTVIHTRSPVKAKIFVKELPEAIVATGPLFAIRVTNNSNGEISWINPVVIISIESHSKDGKDFSIINTSSTTQPKFFVSETPTQINDQLIRKAK